MSDKRNDYWHNVAQARRRKKEAEEREKLAAWNQQSYRGDTCDRCGKPMTGDDRYLCIRCLNELEEEDATP